MQACLNAPEPATGENGVDEGNPVESPEEPAPQHLPQQGRPGMPPAGMQHPGYMTQEQQQQAIAYQNYMSQQQRTGYSMPQAGMPQQHAHQA